MHSSIIEGAKEALERLQLDYVDIIFAHRPDNTGKSMILRFGGLYVLTFPCSPNGRSCPCLQLRNRERLGEWDFAILIQD